MTTNAKVYSRCETCGKRLPSAADPQPLPCPHQAASASTCPEVKDVLMRSRWARTISGDQPHPETTALMERSGWTDEALDAAIAQGLRRDADESELRNAVAMTTPIQEWIGDDEARAILVAQWALQRIDLTNGGTLTMLEIEQKVDEIAESISNFIRHLAAQDWEHEA